MNVHRDKPPQRERNSLVGLVMLGMLCLTAVVITYLVTS